MAPTEILAEQHAATLAEWLEPHGVTVAFLAGSTKAKARRDLLEKLESGEVDLLIGTHALIQPDVIFQKSWDWLLRMNSIVSVSNNGVFYGIKD